MRNAAFAFHVLALALFAHGMAQAQTLLSNAALGDTLYHHRGLRIASRAEAFFYNAEFDHPLKVGYTLPGWVLMPQTGYHYGHFFSVEVAWYAAQMMGQRRAWHSLPLLRLASSPVEGLSIAMGALRSALQHDLPDFIYSPQYRWLARPELGVQIDYHRSNWRVEAWIDWEHFIWRHAEENERFLFGIRGTFGTRRNPGLYAHVFLLAHHSGGQIDATQNPVVTSSNVGGELGYQYICGANRFHLVLSGAQSRDGAKNAPFVGKKGWLLRGQVVWSSGGFTLETAYLLARRFYTLRGEELYASYSLWSEDHYAERRKLLSVASAYEYTLRRMLKFRAEAIGFYDFTFRRIDWAFTLSTAIDLNFWLFSRPLHSQV